MEYKNSVAVCVVGNFKFLRKYLNKFVFQVRETGKFEGDIIILTSFFTPAFLLRLRKKEKVYFIRFKKIKFDRITNESLNNLNTNGQPNRHTYKNFQWHKVHLFNEKLKKWNYIFYMDINMSIHKSIVPIIETKPLNSLYANRDHQKNSIWQLKNQFDNSHRSYFQLEQDYDLSIKDYFQTGILFYDTNIINKNTTQDILKLVKKYPYSLTNEQAIMNLYFIFEKKLYKELPTKTGGARTYSYWKDDSNSRITKQLVPQYK
jgi:hypothetical protein